MTGCVAASAPFCVGLARSVESVAQEAPVIGALTFTEPHMDTQRDEDKRFDVHMERCAGVEASLDADDAAAKRPHSPYEDSP